MVETFRLPILLSWAMLIYILEKNEMKETKITNELEHFL